MPKATACPGLVIDRFDDTLTVQIGTAGMEKQIAAITMALDAVFKPKTVILRADAPSRALEGLDSYVKTVKGAGARIAVEENGARYIADLAKRPEDRLVLRPARQPRLHRRRSPRARACWTAIQLYRRLRHPGGQGRRQGSRVPGFLGAGAGHRRGKRPRQWREDHRR